MNVLQFASATLDLMFPPVCLFCLEPLRDANTTDQPDSETPEKVQVSPHFRTTSFCERCLAALTQDDWNACERCAAPRIGGRCPYCAERAYAFDESYALSLYQETTQEAVLRTKQARFECLTLGLGQLLGKELRQKLAWQRILGTTSDLARDWGLGNPPIHCAIPIPTHWTRRFKRGVHSAALLGEGVASQLTVPLLSRGLRAVRRTKKQGTLEPQQRFQNVRDVFRTSKRYDFTDAHVLLVDDVMTTGATLHEAAGTLKRAGAAKVSVAVIARGTGLMGLTGGANSTGPNS